MNELLVMFAAVLTTLKDFPEGCPASTLYMACNMDMHKYEKVRDLLLKGKFITVQAHWVTPTQEGIRVARELESAMNKSGGCATGWVGKQ